MSRYCVKCGRFISEKSDKFCRRCGVSLHAWSDPKYRSLESVDEFFFNNAVDDSSLLPKQLYDLWQSGKISTEKFMRSIASYDYSISDIHLIVSGVLSIPDSADSEPNLAGRNLRDFLNDAGWWST